MVARVDLPLGPIAAGEFDVQRSGLRWLVDEGRHCRAGEVVAFCTVGLIVRPGVRQDRWPFQHEQKDFQVLLAPNVSGVLHKRAEASLGGFLDLHQFHQLWDENKVVASLDIERLDSDLRPAWSLSFVAGRRMTEMAEVRAGLLTGWHSQARAWGGEQAGHATLLSLGICEQNGIFRGEGNAFLEMLKAAPGPLNVVQVTDEALSPAAAVLVHQLGRDAAANDAIVADLTQGVFGGGILAEPSDFHFAGGAATRLTRCPLTERYDLLTREGLSACVGAKAVVLSLHSELTRIFRHRKLGYFASWHNFRVGEAGTATRQWITSNFDNVDRTLADIQNDLSNLRRALAELGCEHMLILNVMSSSGYEDIVSYAAFEGPLGDTLGTIRAKEANLMLHDLASTCDIAIVDVDAIAAGLGGASHLPDAVHQSGILQGEVRSEIMHILEQRGFFARRS